MKNYIYLFSVLLFVSCGNKEQTITDTTVKTDSSVVENTSSFVFNNKDFKELSLPLNIDTTFIQKVDTNNRITYQQIRQLGVNFVKGELGEGLVYDINEFAQIDSLKQSGGYKAYLETLDIGMTKTCIAYKVSLINLPNSNKLFIWGITNATFEACPFFSGTLLIGTFVNKNQQATLFNIAEISGGGDPPAMMDTKTEAKIGVDGKIEITCIVTNDDMDIPGVAIEKKTFTLVATENGITVGNSKTEILSKEDEPKLDQ
ncbi:MAG: hypothetical protein JNJ40_05155 [Bacteroidia bacterium]|nr:hypothetical protein [Bacteroidia bacterium]